MTWFSVDEAYNKTIKIERLHNRAPPFRRLMLLEDPLGGEGTQQSFTIVDQPPAQLMVKASYRNQQQHPPQPWREKKNSYAKSRIGKWCYRCGSLDIGPINVQRGSKLTSQIMEMKTMESWSRTQVILTFPKIWRSHSLCCSKIALQSENPWHHTTASNLLLKMFDQRQGMQSHHQ